MRDILIIKFKAGLVWGRVLLGELVRKLREIRRIILEATLPSSFLVRNSQLSSKSPLEILTMLYKPHNL